jgi:hypothetical protein
VKKPRRHVQLHLEKRRKKAEARRKRKKAQAKALAPENEVHSTPRWIRRNIKFNRNTFHV